MWTHLDGQLASVCLVRRRRLTTRILLLDDRERDLYFNAFPAGGDFVPQETYSALEKAYFVRRPEHPSRRDGSQVVSCEDGSEQRAVSRL